MLQFDKKIEAVFNRYHERIRQETVLSESLTMDEVMGRIDDFLLPVGPETGLFLNSLVKAAKSNVILELGTSYGYSTVWLAEAARVTNGRVITMELSDEKSGYAQEKLQEAGLAAYVDFRVGDAVQLLKEATETFDFVLVDLWKELYLPCLNEFYTKLNKGAWVIADNIIHPPQHHNEIDVYRNRIKELVAFETLLLPLGSGIKVSQLKT